MTHSEQALQWLSEGKTVLLAGKEVSEGNHGLIRWNGLSWYVEEFDPIAQGFVDAGLTLDCKEPEPKVKIRTRGVALSDPGWTWAIVYVKGNVTEAQLKAALESIGEKQ